MTRVIVSRDKLVAIANAIRSKSETTDALTLDEMPSAVEGIQAGGGSCDYAAEDGLISGEISAYRNDRITNVWEYSFYQHSALVSVDLPNVTNIGQYAFYKSVNLESVNFPNLITLGTQSLRMCTALKSVNFPYITGTLWSYMLDGCTSLERADFGQLDAVGSNSMNGCSSLHTVILRRTNKIASLQGTTALRGTLIEAGTGYVYVPRDLVDSYKVASNWTTYADQIRAIEDYPEITGG